MITPHVSFFIPPSSFPFPHQLEGEFDRAQDMINRSADNLPRAAATLDASVRDLQRDVAASSSPGRGSPMRRSSMRPNNGGGSNRYATPVRGSSPLLRRGPMGGAGPSPRRQPPAGPAARASVAPPTRDSPVAPAPRSPRRSSAAAASAGATGSAASEWQVRNSGGVVYWKNTVTGEVSETRPGILSDALSAAPSLRETDNGAANSRRVTFADQSDAGRSLARIRELKEDLASIQRSLGGR